MLDNPEVAFGGSQRMLAMIETIYAAVQQPELWSTVLGQIGEAVEGQSSALLFDTPPAPHIPHVLTCAGTSAGFLSLFVTHYASVNVLAAPCDQLFPTGTARYSHLAVPDAEFDRSEFLNDFFKPHGMYYSLGLKVSFGQGSQAYLSIQRAKSLRGFGDREGIVLETLMPHLQRAFNLHHQLAGMSSAVLGLESSLDALEQAVFGLNADGSIVFSNRRAEAIAQAADGLCVSNGRLSAVFHEQNRRLDALVSDAVATATGMGLSSGGALLIDRKSGKRPLRLTVTPFASPLPGRSQRVAALVFLSDPASRPQSRGAILRALYGLSPTEARVADLLLQGLEVREVANHLGTTLETARFHTKRILAKTGTRRQTELMRLMLSLPGI